MPIYFESRDINKPAFLGEGQWNLKGLNEITVLFGKNGSGKSLLLRTLYRQDLNIYHYSSPERSGDIHHDAGTMDQQLNANQRSSQRDNNLAPNFRQEAVSRIQAVSIKIGNKLRISNQLEENHNYDKILDEIEVLVSFLLPDFKFKITGDNPPFSLMRELSGENVTTVNTLSSGESEIFALGLDLITICALWELESQRERVLLIDEPDTHLHPDLQQHLGLFLTRLLEKYKIQIIVATHSTTLLSSLGLFGGEKTSIIYLVNSENEQKAVKFNKSLQKLSACLGGHALMGPLFGAPLLLVEGDDDNKIWSQVPRHHQINFAVIPCFGVPEVKKYQKTLEQIFSCLRDEQSAPVGFALLDGDQTLPRETSHPQNNIKFIKLACHESENLYLADEVLETFELDWEAAKEKIKSKSHHFPNKKESLDQCETWDRKTVDLKGLITALNMILGPKQRPWTLEVAKCIGKGRPEGQLAEFLGEDLIVSLWGPAPDPTVEDSDSEEEASS